MNVVRLIRKIDAAVVDEASLAFWKAKRPGINVHEKRGSETGIQGRNVEAKAMDTCVCARAWAVHPAQGVSFNLDLDLFFFIIRRIDKR